jgi:hypothetical protein
VSGILRIMSLRLYLCQVEITEDSSSMDQLLEAFHNLANGDRLITEKDMRQAHLPLEVTNFLKQTMQVVDEQGHAGYDCELRSVHIILVPTIALMRRHFPHTDEKFLHDTFVA